VRNFITRGVPFLKTLHEMAPCSYAPTGEKAFELNTEEVLRLERRWQRFQKSGRSLFDMLQVAGLEFMVILAQRASEQAKADLEVQTAHDQHSEVSE
jgi:hypothetical protein